MTASEAVAMHRKTPDPEAAGMPVQAPAFDNVEQAKAYLAAHDVKYVLAQFVDIHGVAKTKSVPVKYLENILTAGAGFAGFAVWGLGMEPHGPDYMAVGDLSTLQVLPWQPGYARIICNGHVEGKPHALDTRNVLREQVARLADKGWIINTGLEPEFMLLGRDAAGRVRVHDPADTLQKPCYDYKGLCRNAEFLERLTESLIAMGIDVYQIDHEDANGQFEVNYHFADGLTSADQLTTVRMASAEIARDLGMICSFMPKPFSNRTGNGMHMHISMSPLDDPKANLFNDESDALGMGLSKLAYHFMGGLMKHAPALAAMCAPSVNSYKRLVVGRSLSGSTWAPAYISYGNNNRTSMLRVPHGRIEMRLPDSAANPYLATAAVIAAGLDGIENEIDPGKPSDFNHYEMSLSELHAQGVEVLPQNLGEALDALDADPLFEQVLGTHFIREFKELKRMEWVEYMRHVSDWELERYVEFY